MTTATITVEHEPIATATLGARAAATAWLNAFLATSQDENRPTLYRSMSVEFFSRGVQFIATDGTILLRTWAPLQDGIDTSWPEIDEAPDVSVVVMDHDKFAVGFIRAALAAAGDLELMPLTLSLESAEPAEGPALGEALAPSVLCLSAFGQRLNCKLYESPYPNWRALEFGIDASERVSGLTVAPRMFATLGKIREAFKIDTEFRGTDKAIDITAHGIGYVVARGLVMPMRREDAEPKRKRSESHNTPEAEQLDSTVERDGAA